MILIVEIKEFFRAMIRLVTCDIDGTLLMEGEWELDPAFFDTIRRLLKNGIAFAAASGRQHYRLRKMFEPVAKDIFFICENGAVVYEGDTPLSETRLDPVKARRLMEQILAHPECEILISGAESCYLLPKKGEDCDYVRHIRETLGYRTVIVHSLDEIREPIIKVTASRWDGVDAILDDFAMWNTEFSVAVAGKEWLDFTLADKGTGLDDITARLGISNAEVMSFGDNFNDLPLLEKVGHPYIMENGAEELKQRFPDHCVRVADTLEAFLSALA